MKLNPLLATSATPPSSVRAPPPAFAQPCPRRPRRRTRRADPLQSAQPTPARREAPGGVQPGVPPAGARPRHGHPVHGVARFQHLQEPRAADRHAALHPRKRPEHVLRERQAAHPHHRRKGLIERFPAGHERRSPSRTTRNQRADGPVPQPPARQHRPSSSTTRTCISRATRSPGRSGCRRRTDHRQTRGPGGRQRRRTRHPPDGKPASQRRRRACWTSARSSTIPKFTPDVLKAYFRNDG